MRVTMKNAVPLQHQPSMVNREGYFGEYGGVFVAETLVQPVQELQAAYQHFKNDTVFQKDLAYHLQHFVGRPTPLTFAKRLSASLGGAALYLKREDLAHTGAHKINNVLGQALLAKAMGKQRIIAETGAGQHGVATAAVCAMLNLECTVYMGAVDVKRQAANVYRMQLMGASVKPVQQGAGTLKAAVSEALRDWVKNPSSYYLLGSVVGPHPYPTMVRDFQKIIGLEMQEQILSAVERLPDECIACVGGGSNALGFFYPMLPHQSVILTGVEAGGVNLATGEHAARFVSGKDGVFQGMKTKILQNHAGQILPTYSISAGLDYPAVGPEHAHLHASGRVQYTSISDDECLAAAQMLCQYEGILPALESAHALAYGITRAKQLSPEHILVVNLSGRGDKDLTTFAKYFNLELPC